MIIAIDGPAASGKSTTAKLVANKSGFTYLDTGAMYRAVTYAVIDQKIHLDDSNALSMLLENLELEMETNSSQTSIFVNKKDVTSRIRNSDITNRVSAVSAIPMVRHAMVSIQRKLGTGQNCVMEGRDIGTVVFPEADLKFFLVADYTTRAKRRLHDLEQIGETKSIEELVEELKIRDEKDSNRQHSPLVKAKGAIEIDTSDLSIDDQVRIILKHIKKITNKEKGMLEKTESRVVEEAKAEESVDVSAVLEEKESASTTDVTPINYLNPDLFIDTKTIKVEDLVEDVVEEELSEEIQNKYLGTFSDISEKQVIESRVIGMNDNEILLDIGFKSEGIISRKEFEDGQVPEIGSTLSVYLERLEDRNGNLILSKSKADFMRRWSELKDIFESGEIFTGKIIRRIKGGMIVDVGIIQAFLPGSQIDVRPITDFDHYLDKEIELRVVKLNEARKNIVVSHKIILEESLKEQREALFEKIKVGETMEGRVKNITDFGVFVDLGGLDGLLHITDMSWGRVSHPSEIVSMDDKLIVKIIDYDEENRRVSLGLKQLSAHPWENVEDKYPVGQVVDGKVVSMTNYGAFIEIEPGVEGLIHVSEMSWTRHIKNPSELVSMGVELKAQVLSIDVENRKISLGIKQLLPDPWDEIEEKYMVGTVQKGKISNLTQFGAFVGLEDGVDGLIHVSDLSWTKVVRHPKEIIEKGQEVEVRILDVSRENRRISLGLKQVEDDPWPELIQLFDTGKNVEGEIIRILDKGIILNLEQDVEGIIPFGKRSKRERKEISQQFNLGDMLEGIVMEVKPEEKKVVLFREDMNRKEKTSRPKDEVREYLKNQDAEATQKLEIPTEIKAEESTDPGE